MPEEPGLTITSCDLMKAGLQDTGTSLSSPSRTEAWTRQELDIDYTWGQAGSLN